MALLGKPGEHGLGVEKRKIRGAADDIPRNHPCAPGVFFQDDVNRAPVCLINSDEGADGLVVLVDLHLRDFVRGQVLGQDTVFRSHQVQPFNIEFVDIAPVVENSSRPGYRNSGYLFEKVTKDPLGAVGKSSGRICDSVSLFFYDRGLDLGFLDARMILRKIDFIGPCPAVEACRSRIEAKAGHGQAVRLFPFGQSDGKDALSVRHGIAVQLLSSVGEDESPGDRGLVCF